MAESIFLPLQDVNGDGLNDVCKEQFSEPEQKVCPKCTPNPSAVVPNWRTRSQFHPFLNEKVCRYSISITARNHTSIIDNSDATEEEADAALNDIYEAYADEAIETLLQVYGYENSEATVEIMRESLDYSDYFLDPRPNSRIRLLYTVPFEVMDALPDADLSDEEAEVGPEDVTFKASELGTKLIRLRKALNLYKRYLAVYRGVEGGNILFRDDRVFSIEDYGDLGGGIAGSIMYDLGQQLSDFLSAYGLNLPSVGSLGVFSGNDTITEITFGFSENYKVDKIICLTEGCGSKPIVFTQKTNHLNSMSAWKDQTAVAYFSRLNEIDQSLLAREPMNWVDFLIEYTYPEIYATDVEAFSANQGSCVGEALREEAKQLGQDILDEVFSLGDAIAFKFHATTCKTNLRARRNEELSLGLTPQRRAPLSYATPSLDDIVIDSEDPRNKIISMAYEQAYRTVDQGDEPCLDLCENIGVIIGGADDESFDRFKSCLASEIGINKNNIVESILEDLMDQITDIKQCGLFDFLLSGIQCLFTGLTLEQALSKMVEVALNEMSIDNFGQLFVGLPPERQQELEDLVRTKLENGDVFPDDSYAQEISNAYSSDGGSTQIWNQAFQEDMDRLNEAVREAAGEAQESGDEPYSVQLPSSDPFSDDLWSNYERVEVRTLAQSFDNLGSGLDSSVVMQAYVGAIIEVYSDNLLELVDELGKFPGAPIIANIIALLDCPRPPLFVPSVMDFLKDIELPFCRNIDDIVFPKFINPLGWLPKIKDIFRILFLSIKCALKLAMLKIIAKIFVKLCELIGNAICNAIGLTGDIASSLPDLLSGNQTLSEVIRESICGDTGDGSVSQDKINEAIADIVSSLGVGGAALADQSRAISFMEDMSSSLTENEVYQLLLGEATNESLAILDSVIEYEYPDYRDAIPNTQSIARFFRNIGNLTPASFRDSLRGRLSDEGAVEPINPSICADPERLEEYRQLRCDLLEGRATPEQCNEMFCSMREQMLDDLGDLGAIVNSIGTPEGLEEYLGNQLPQLVSSPGCEDGVIPYEPTETAIVASSNLSNDLETIKVEFAEDMLGNGPGKRNWGMINMMMADTMGAPLSTHIRKVGNSVTGRYVDFYTTDDLDDEGIADIFRDDPGLGLGLFEASLRKQRGAYPTHVGRYLQEYMNDVSDTLEVSFGNLILEDESKTVEVTRGTRDITALPDFGYNINIVPLVDEDGDVSSYFITSRARNPDLSMSFRDNAKGLASRNQSDYYYGFDLEAYIGDIAENEDGVITNINSDNMRIKITELVNNNANIESPLGESVQIDADGEEKRTKRFRRQADIIKETSYEFLSVDNTLSDIGPDGVSMQEFLSEYPNFLNCFEQKNTNTPQAVLMKEILEQKNETVSITTTQIQQFQSSVFQKVIETVFATVADLDADLENSSWAYGAAYDGLTVQDLQYGIVEDDNFIPYSETELDNTDLTLGISYNQFLNEQEGTPEETRVFYLDPTEFGGNYVAPPLYIKPERTKGYLAMLDVFFPEFCVCEPQVTDLIDFGEIQSFVSEVYDTIPEDDRLKSEPDCIVELPYNRVLDRSAKAGIIGLIKSAIRIYASTHMFKALPTFTKFAPNFPEVFSSAYSSFIVEDMQKSFLDTQPAFGEFFNTFKDNEFWYSFLEQTVQTYAYLVDTGKIEPPQTVLDALFRLNDMQEVYEYPDKEDLKEAKDTGETKLFKTLKNYRLEKNLEAIKQTEEDAKIVMKEFVSQELNYMAKKLIINLENTSLTAEVKDLDYYFLENFTQGTSLTLNAALGKRGVFKQEYGDLPTIPWFDNDQVSEPYYTSGGELVVEENRDNTGLSVGQEYIGYYHIHKDDESGNILYMAGEEHIEEAHDLLIPIANTITVPIGDVADFDQVSFENVEDSPFVLEKYIKIGFTKYSTSDALEIINSNEDTSLLVSDVYPGTLSVIQDDNGNSVGLEGELGVRHGLLFSVVINGEKYELTNVEIDVLDTSLQDVSPIPANSKILLCLINHLKTDKLFKLTSKYMFPMTKATSIVAIYNDLGMLPSIGEVTVDDGQAFAKLVSKGFDVFGKPGLQAVPTITYNYVYDEEGNVIDTVETIDSVDIQPVAGTYDPTDDTVQIGEITGPTADNNSAPSGAWASYDDRSGGLFDSPFFTSWDEWDQILLRNSTRRIKKIFKSYYNSRDFDSGEIDPADRPGVIAIQRLREALKPAPGRRLLNWRLKRRLRTNPFNANGDLCENE